MLVKDRTRQGKISSELKRVLSEFMFNNSIINSGINSALISITDVKVSSCLRHTKVFVVSLSSDFTNEDALSFLQRNYSKIRQYVASKLVLKFVPEIQFFVDDSFENASRIEELLKMLKKSE